MGFGTPHGGTTHARNEFHLRLSPSGKCGVLCRLLVLLTLTERPAAAPEGRIPVNNTFTPNPREPLPAAAPEGHIPEGAMLNRTTAETLRRQLVRVKPPKPPKPTMKPTMKATTLVCSDAPMSAVRECDSLDGICLATAKGCFYGYRSSTTRTHAHTPTCTHTCTHTRTHAHAKRTHARTRARRTRARRHTHPHPHPPTHLTDKHAAELFTTTVCAVQVVVVVTTCRPPRQYHVLIQRPTASSSSQAEPIF